MESQCIHVPIEKHALLQDIVADAVAISAASFVLSLGSLDDMQEPVAELTSAMVSNLASALNAHLGKAFIPDRYFERVGECVTSIIKAYFAQGDEQCPQ